MREIKTFIFLFLIAVIVNAQDSSLKPTTISKAAYMIEIPALSKMENIIAAKGFEGVAPPKRRGTNTIIKGKGLPKGLDPLMQKQIAVNATVNRAAIGTTISSFDAHLGTVLNDPTGAIGPNHYVYAFNTGFGILSRTGAVLLPEASLGTLFPGETLGDPVVVYDKFADRFIIMEFSDSPNGFLIAICQGPDPVNDGWFTYRFNTGTFPDYEKLSVWGDGYYITANKDQNAPASNDVVFAVERDLMIAGNANAQMIGFPLPSAKNAGFYSPGGFNALGASLPPVGVGHPIAYMQDDAWSGVTQDHLKIWTVNVNWNTPNNSSISTPQTLNTAAFDSVFDGGSFQNLNEPGSGPDIDALQGSMMYMTNYRRFGTHNSAVMNFVVDVSGNDTVAGIRWYELRQTSDNAPWTIYQEGTYSQPNGQSAFCGSIAMDSQGNIGLGYTVVSSTVYTSLRYTGRLASDPLGTMTIAEQNLANGDAQTNRSDGRYGDYAQLTLDPLDDLTFWHIGEYMKGSASTVRRSRVSAFKITNSGGGGNGGGECTAEVSAFPYNEGYENILGAWTQDAGDDLNWTIDSNGTPSSNTGPSSADQGTYYIYVEASGNGTGFPNKRAIINSPCYDLNSVATATFSFKYHMFGSTDMGSIDLEASTDNGSSWASIWNQTGNQGNVWNTVSIDLTAYIGANVKLRFNRVTGGTWEADIALDAVSLTTTNGGGGSSNACTGGITSFPYAEGYENTIGAWTQASGDDLNWTVDANGTPSGNTGPSSATQGTYYIYVEASGNGTGFPNKQAIINSPCYDLSSSTNATFSFQYHMFGSTDMGSIDLEASNDDGNSWSSIWSQTGNQGNTWNSVSVNLATYIGDSVQLRFNRVTGGTWQADVAIDNVALTANGNGGGSNNNCAASALTLTINLDNYPEETAWTLKNSGGTTVASNSYSTANPDGSTVTENINGLSSGDYTFTITDSANDGICCGYGNGSYSLISSVGEIISGGDFGTQEVTDFCVDSTKQRLNTFVINKEDLFTIYPNPVQDTFKIDTNGEEINQILIFSVLGKRMNEFSLSEVNTNINVSKLTSGTYFVRIISGDSIITKKFVKK